MQFLVKGHPYRDTPETQTILVAKTVKLKGRKRMVQIRKGIEPPIWCIGFESYDAKGIVYQDPYRNGKWLFFREEERIPVYKKPLFLTSSGKPRRASLKELVSVGIMNEQEMVRQLRPLLKPLFVYTLPWSGQHTQGTDIIITKHEELDFTEPMIAVRRSEYAVSLLGVSNTVFNTKTPIVGWYERCLKDKTRPVVAWVEDRWTEKETPWYVILNEESLRAMFYRDDKPLLYHPSRRRALPFRISQEKFSLEVIKVL
jgi:hypothetical protein